MGHRKTSILDAFLWLVAAASAAVLLFAVMTPWVEGHFNPPVTSPTSTSTTGVFTADGAVAPAGEAPAPPATVATSAEPTPTDGSYFDFAMATAILTRPDAGPSGKTVRWDRDVVGVHVDLPAHYDQRMFEAVDEALVWLTEVTGTRFVEVDDPASAQIKVVGKSGDGGRATATASPDAKTLMSATVRIGCCRERVVWEELGQIAGAFGDRGDDRSIFSNSRERSTPSQFDEWVLRALYLAPPGTSADELALYLEAALPGD